MKRFKIKNERNLVVFMSDSLPECVEWVRNNDTGLNDYYIEDVKDDIEVDAAEILLAFDEGEHYFDLQAF